MTNIWPPWAQSHNTCEAHNLDNCPECEEPMWNPELVAKLEAERASGLPRRAPKMAAESPSEIAKRRQLAAEIARTKVQRSGA